MFLCGSRFLGVNDFASELYTTFDLVLFISIYLLAALQIIHLKNLIKHFILVYVKNVLKKSTSFNVFNYT